ncbi:MAG TPA: methyltransferase [Chthoniobacteraceae bacterium]|nr:methyltransferase [Chthoniobacteraceae bacterium]
MTDWEERYQAGDMPWEKGAPSPPLLEYLASNPPLAGKILVPGCGYGHDIRAFSNANNEPLGIDIAPSAIRGAQSYPKVARENYQLADLFNLPAEFTGRFDWVWEHTCFCAIDPAMRPRYAQSVAAALKPGGRLLAIFYLNPDNDEDGPPHRVSLAELDSLFTDYFSLEREWLPAKTFPGREGREWMRLLVKRRDRI